MLLDMDDNYEVTFGVALWLAVASMVTSVIAFIIPLIPVCVDHDAKKQAIPSGTSDEFNTVFMNIKHSVWILY